MSGSYVFKHALSDFVRLKRFGIWVFVAVALFGIAKVFLRFGTTDDLREMYGLLSSTLVFRVLPLISAVYTTAVIAGEVEQKTIVYLLTRPIPRQQLILFRAAASILVVFALACLSAIAVSVAVFGAGGFSNDLLYRDIAAIAVGSFAYGGLFLALSLLFNRAMIVCLLFAFGWETSVPNMPGDLSMLSIFSYLQAIAQHPQTTVTDLLGVLSGGLVPNLMSVSRGYQTMIVFSLITFGFAAFWFNRFEYTPREDAE